MDSQMMTFHKIFKGYDPGFEKKSVRNLSKAELKANILSFKKSYEDLSRTVREQKRDATDEENDALGTLIKLQAVTEEEWKVREESGEWEPRTVRIGLSGKKTAPAETSPRFGEIGLRYRSLYYGREDVKLDGGDFETKEDFLRAIAFNSMEVRTMSGLAGSSGGFTVPELWWSEIYDSTVEESVTLSRARIFPMKSEVLHIPAFESSDHTAGPIGGFNASWLSETGTATEVTPTMRSITLTAAKAGIYCSASREVLADGVGLSSQIGPILTRSIGYFIDDCLISGSGVGRPLGIIGAPSTIAVSRTVANQIAYADVVALYARIYPAFVKNAVWIANPATLPQLLTMSDPGSHYIWMPSGADGVAGAVAGTLLGRPLYISEKASNLGTKGDLILADLSAYALGLRQDVVFESSNAPGWLQDTMSFRVILRLAGQPLLANAITPKSGGNSLSWAAVLE